MAGNVKPIPEGYHSVTPYLIVNGAVKAIEFYKKVFGATEKFRMPMADGRLGHAEIVIGDSVIMLADEHPETGLPRSSCARAATSVSIMLYVEDVDAVAPRFVAVRWKSAAAGKGPVLWRSFRHV